MESILISIKKLLGITEEQTDFDVDVVMHINSTFTTLLQLGVGPDSGFSITDEDDTWDDFIPDSPLREMVKQYVYMKVKLIFDPPPSTAVMDSMKRTTDELEGRMMVQMESFKT